MPRLVLKELRDNHLISTTTSLSQNFTFIQVFYTIRQHVAL